MPKTFSNIWIHATWAVKYRLPILQKPWRIELFKHVKLTAEEKQIQLDMINGVEDHVHILFKLKTTQTVSEILKIIKGESSHWINQNPNITFPEDGLFAWQDGYGAISVSPNRIQAIRNYIKRQEQHHKKMSFDDELKNFQLFKNI